MNRDSSTTGPPRMTTEAGARTQYGAPIPKTLRRWDRGSPPPALDVADFLRDDIEGRGLAHLNPETRDADDRLAGFVRLAEDGTPYGLSRTDVIRTLTELLDETREDFAALAAHEKETRRRLRRRNLGEPETSRAARSLGAVRDTLARINRSAHPLLATLAEQHALSDGEEIAEDAARDFLRDLPRERLKRSDAVRRYREAGSPGALGRNDFLALARSVYPDAERRDRVDGWLFDLSEEHDEAGEVRQIARTA